MIGVLPEGWAALKLSDICKINPRGKSGLAGDDEVSFVPMAAVSEISGSIVAAEIRQLKDVQKGFTPFQEGDVLFAKITPCMENGKAAIARNLVNQRGYGSTEFHVIRPSTMVLAEWIFAIIRTTEFRRAAASSFQGAVGQQRIPSSFLETFIIPLPPLSEQQRIIEILQEAEEIRRLRAEAESKTSDLVSAMFRWIFGEIGRNTKHWPITPVSSFVESFQGGKSLAGNEGDFDTSRPRVLKISAVTSGFLIPSESKALPSTYEPPAEHFVRSGDLLITRANTEELVGATAFVEKGCPANLVLPDKIWRFVWKDNFQGTPEFVWALFQDKSTRKAIGNIASGTGGSMKNISMKKLMQMRVIWPPKAIQETFSQALREVLDLCNSTQGDRAAQRLQSSLSAHAFSGRLTAGWRESRMDQLTVEARDRDAALKDIQPSFSNPPVAILRSFDNIYEQPTDGIYSDLNREQRALLHEIENAVNRMDYLPYFTAEQLAAFIEGPLHRHPQKIESHLAVFAVRGLLIPISLQRKDNTGPTFAACYRLPGKGIQPSVFDAEYDPDENDDIRIPLMDAQRKFATGMI